MSRSPSSKPATPPKPTIELGATPSVNKRVQSKLPPGVESAWRLLKAKLQKDPRFVKPDKRTIWGKAWSDLPNHRHDDLPGAWRVCWTIRNADGGKKEEVTIIFFGTHTEYNQLYGYK